MIREECVFCGATFKVPDSLAGRKVRCPKCKETIGISARPSDAPTAQLDAQEAVAEPDLGPSSSLRLATVVGVLAWVALVIGVVVGVGAMLLMPAALDGVGLDPVGSPVRLCVSLGLGALCVVLGGVFCAVCLFVQRSLNLQAEIVRRLDEIIDQADRALAEFRQSRRSSSGAGK